MKLLLNITWIFFILGPSLQAHTTVQALVPVVEREEGFMVCGGGSASPLFSKDCKQATVSRLPEGGYEGLCLDHNGKTFLLACQSLSFEYAKTPEGSQKSTYWEKSKENKGP